jgi:transcriptional regulator with GAF, ATPase, and Fis domain
VSPAVQVKLLRFLQQQEFERVGETRTRKVDVRVIAATNRDLRQAMRNGSFREDLYYRLRVFPIHIPPLRERLDDVPLLVHSFVRRFSQKTGKQISGFDAEAMRALLDYGWPGNVRELENAIEFAFVTCAGGKAGLLDLPQEIRRAEWREGGSAHADPAGETVSAELAESILHDEKRLAAAVSSAGWNKAQVARDLGVARKTVWKWMKRHGLPLQPAADPAQMELDTHT